jgi:biopolymer transport protein ExbD
MSTWQVRPEGSRTVATVPSDGAVVSGLREGLWLPTDEVKGPADAAFVPIEAHPAFEDAAAELEPPRPESKDETHLDMNPLIDVCLVLLIFFILTITYESLKRVIEMPAATEEQKAGPKINYPDVKDRVVLVQARMDGDKPVIKVEKQETPLDKVQEKIKEAFGTKKAVGKREMILDVEGAVPWGVQTSLMDAAKANNVDNIIYPPPKKSAAPPR